MGIHYARALISGYPRKPCEQFAKQRYTFYEYQRRIPPNKHEAYVMQYRWSIQLLAAAGIPGALAEALRAVEASEVAYFEKFLQVDD